MNDDDRGAGQSRHAMPRLTLRHIEIFHAVYEHRTISAAARALGISQPSVTQTLGHAESQLGFALFQRESRRLVPTEDAHHLFVQAQEVHRSVDMFRLLGHNMRIGRGTRIAVSALPLLALGLVPAAVANFLDRYPDCFFDLHTCHHDMIASHIASGEAQVVLALERPDGAPLAEQKLGRGRLGVLASRGDMSGEAALWDRLSGQRLIDVTHSGPLGDRIAGLLAANAVDLDIVASARTFHMAAALVRARVGIAIVDEFTARSALADGLEFLPLEPPTEFDVVALFARDRPPSRHMLVFLESVAALLLHHRPRL